MSVRRANGFSCVICALLLVCSPYHPASAQSLLDGLIRELGRGLGESFTAPPPPPPVQHVPPPPPARHRPPPPPPAGLDRASVVELQRHLIALGYLRGAADGVAGPMTRNALLAFQRDHGLPADGQPSGGALHALRQAAQAPAMHAVPSPAQPHPGFPAQPHPGFPAQPPQAFPAQPGWPVAAPPQAAPQAPPHPGPGPSPAGATIVLPAGGVGVIPRPIAQQLGRYLIAARPDLLQEPRSAGPIAGLLLPDLAAPYFTRRADGVIEWTRLAGANEIAQIRARDAFNAEIVPRLRALAATEPMPLRLVGPVTVGRYDERLASLHLGGPLTDSWRFAGRPLGLILMPPQVLSASLAPSSPLPAQRLDLATAERLLDAAGPQRRLTAVAEIEVLPERTGTSGAILVRITSLTLHRDAAGATPPVFALPVEPAAPGALAAPGGAAPDGAAIVFSLTDHASRRAAPLALGRAVVAALPELLEDPAGLLAATALAPEAGFASGRQWAGADAFAREANRERAARDLPELIRRQAAAFPLTLTLVSSVTIGAYDARAGSFAIVERGQQMPLVAGIAGPPVVILPDRGMPATLPVPPDQAAALFRSLPGDGDRRMAQLRTVLRFEAPPRRIPQGNTERLLWEAQVTEQAIFADPGLTRLIAGEEALRGRSAEAGLVAAFAAPLTPPAALVLDESAEQDTLLLMALRAGLAAHPLQTGFGPYWMATFQRRPEAAHAWAEGVTGPALAAFARQAEEPILLRHFMAWNQRRAAALPEAATHRHALHLRGPWNEALRLPLLPDRLVEGQRLTGGRPPVRFRFAEGAPDALVIEAAMAEALGRAGAGSRPVEVTARFRVTDYAMGPEGPVVTLAAEAAEAVQDGTVLARLGAAPAPAAAAAPMGAPAGAPVGVPAGPALFGLHPGQGLDAARPLLLARLGADARMLRLHAEPPNVSGPPPGAPVHGVAALRAAGGEQLALFLAEAEGPVVGILHQQDLPAPMPAEQVLAALTAQYGPPHLRGGQVQRPVHGMPLRGLELAWSFGPAPGGRALLPAERRSCPHALRISPDPPHWWDEAPPRFGQPRGAPGPRSLEAANQPCGTVLRVILQGEADQGGPVTRLLAALADTTALAALRADRLPPVATLSQLATDMPDVVGLAIGMPWPEAVATAERHLADPARLALEPPAMLDPARRRPYSDGLLLVRRDNREAIGLYRAAVGEAPGQVVGVWRRLLLPRGAATPAQIEQGLVAKYGPPDHREGGQLRWGADRRTACGDLADGSSPEAAEEALRAFYAALGITPRPGQPVRFVSPPPDSVMMQLPAPNALFLGQEATMPNRMPRLLACRPHVGAALQEREGTGQLVIDQWSLDEGGYAGLLEAMRAPPPALAAPAAPAVAIPF